MPRIVAREQDRRQRRRQVAVALETVHIDSHAAADAEASARQRGEDLQALEEACPEFSNAHRTITVAYGPALLGLLAVYGIDVFCLASIAEYLAAMAFGGLPGLVAFGKFLFPALVLWLEVQAAHHRSGAAELRADEPDVRAPYYMWTVIACVLSLAVPSAVIAAILVSPLHASRGAPWLMFALCSISLVGHLNIIFSGDRLHEALAYRSFERERRNLRRAIDDGARSRSELTQRAGRSFQRYLDRADDFNRLYPDAPLQHGPFDATTRRILNGAFGYSAIQEPSPATGAEPTDSRPVPGVQDEAAVRLRAAEREVRP